MNSRNPDRYRKSDEQLAGEQTLAEQVDLDAVPSTIEKAVEMLVGNLADEDKEKVRKMSGAGAHHSLGRGVRNSWSLWSQDTPLHHDAKNTYEIAHADDISGLIMAWALARVVGEDFDPQEHCKRYFEHWAQYGQTPLEAGGVTKDPDGPTPGDGDG